MCLSNCTGVRHLRRNKKFRAQCNGGIFTEFGTLVWMLYLWRWCTPAAVAQRWWTSTASSSTAHSAPTGQSTARKWGWVREARPYHYRWIFGKVPKGGGGVISDPKNFVAKFLALETPIWGSHFRSKNFRRKNCNIFPKKGGRSKTV